MVSCLAPCSNWQEGMFTEWGKELWSMCWSYFKPSVQKLPICKLWLSFPFITCEKKPQLPVTNQCTFPIIGRNWSFNNKTLGSWRKMYRRFGCIRLWMRGGGRSRITSYLGASVCLCWKLWKIKKRLKKTAQRSWLIRDPKFWSRYQKLNSFLWIFSEGNCAWSW